MTIAMNPSEQHNETTQHSFPAASGRVLLLLVAAIGAGVTISLVVETPGAWHAGYVQARSRTISAIRDARIIKILVKPGQLVYPGEPLLELTDHNLEQTFRDSEREVAELEAALTQAQAQAKVELSWRLKNLEADIFDTRLTAARLQQEKFSREVEKIASEELLKRASGDVPAELPIGIIRRIDGSSHSLSASERLELQLKMNHAENALEVAQAQEELCDKQLARLETLKQELPAQIEESVGVKVAEARLAMARADLERLAVQLDALTVVATAAGTVGVLQKRAGDHVLAGEPIVELFDEKQPFILAPVPSTELADFRPGTEVRLSFSGNVDRRGTVRTIPPQAGASPGATVVSRVSVHIEPEGRGWPDVPFGSTVEVRTK